MLDFLIVTMSLFTFGNEKDLGVVKVVRMLRILKPLRVISRSSELKVSI